MRVISVSSRIEELVETDAEEWPSFSRSSSESWLQLMGESWESVYDEGDIEAAYQEYMAENPVKPWTKQFDSSDLDLTPSKTNLADWFNTNYEHCKDLLRWAAKKEGADPDRLEFDIKMKSTRWDVSFTVTATERGERCAKPV
ncbi:MAG: hypothetical protein EHM35_00630 [Planctomycetaceae bacterium]|nr:MAG: hypothetical protein EHM35_00630 [Planctomycetaceae bacterium]